MSGSSETASERVVSETGLLSWLGITIDSESEGRAVLRLPHRSELTNPNGDMLHGGVLATLLDNAAGTALRTLLNEPETAHYATTEMNLSYLRPATGNLRAEARVRRRGNSVAVIEVDIDSERAADGWTTVAVGRASYYVDESR